MSAGLEFALVGFIVHSITVFAVYWLVQCCFLSAGVSFSVWELPSS